MRRPAVAVAAAAVIAGIGGGLAWVAFGLSDSTSRVESPAPLGGNEPKPSTTTTDTGATSTTRGSTVTTRATAPSAAAAPLRYTFPVEPPAVASYGRSHHDYPATDVFAPCGTPYLAPTGGVVHELSRVDRWDPALNDGATRGGLFVSIVGDDGVRYYASHLASVATDVESGTRVESGARLGTVGQSGNAGGTGCHVHFGVSPPCKTGEWSVRRGVVYPWPYLDAWRMGEPRSPAPEIAAWHADHPNACDEAVSPNS